MPRWHALPGSCAPDTSHPLAPGYYRWTLGISTQSPVWRDSVAVNGPAWGRDISNMAKWLPGAQVHPFMEGYAMAGDSVRVRLRLVPSLSWPFTVWAAACTDSCSPCLARRGSFAHN